MRNIYFLPALILLALIPAYGLGQAAPQKKTRKKAAKPPATPNAGRPTIQVRVVFTNGKEVSGRLIDISPTNVAVDPGNGTVVAAQLTDVASLTIGQVIIPSATNKKPDPQFVADADNAFRQLQALAVATENNISFNEYKPKLAQTKAGIDAFLVKYERSGQFEVLKTMRDAMRGFELVLPVWSLRVGYEQHKYVIENSDQMRPIIETFPEIRQVTWRQNERYPIEKVIPWLWTQSARLIEQSKLQLAKMR